MIAFEIMPAFAGIILLIAAAVQVAQCSSRGQPCSSSADIKEEMKIMTLKNEKNSKHGYFWRFVISLIGLGMILMALNETALYLIGDTTTGTVATRRVGRSSSGHTKLSQQYKWSVSWTYSVDGREYSGSATLRGSATRANYGNTVYYYPFAPPRLRSARSPPAAWRDSALCSPQERAFF